MLSTTALEYSLLAARVTVRMGSQTLVCVTVSSSAESRSSGTDFDRIITRQLSAEAIGYTKRIELTRPRNGHCAAA